MITQAPIWVIDGAAGIYAPQSFIAEYGNLLRGCDAEDVAIVAAGPEHEHYFDAWMDIEDNATVEGIGTIYHDGDIWIIPDGLVWDHETEWWVAA